MQQCVQTNTACNIQRCHGGDGRLKKKERRVPVEKRQGAPGGRETEGEGRKKYPHHLLSPQLFAFVNFPTKNR